jgi:hypothetical protein
MNETYPLWIRAETVEDAATQGQAWADAEPALDFVRVVSVEPHPDFWRVWTVTVETAAGEALQMTLESLG